MSRGLGQSQNLILSALASLESENPGEGLFYVWAIVDRAYALSPEMQGQKAARDAHAEADRTRIQAMADAGDERAALYLGLMRPMVRRRQHPRQRRVSPWSITETAFNPSRVLAGLERRGLVTRDAKKGGGAAALTEQGRGVAAGLSVGTTLRRQPEALVISRL